MTLTSRGDSNLCAYEFRSVRLAAHLPLVAFLDQREGVLVDEARVQREDGLYPLSGDGLREDDRNERWQLGHLATPFPLTRRWNPWESRDPNAVSNDEYLASFDARRVTGSLVIAEFGSGAFHRLVVTGPARGQVWFDDRAADGGLAPEAGFPAWYQNWLHDPK